VPRRWGLGLALLAATLAAPPAARADAADPWLRVTGYLETDTAWRVFEPRVIQKSENRIELELEAALAPGLRLHAIGRTVYDPVGRLLGRDADFQKSPTDYWSTAGSRWVEAELRELYLDWTGRVGPARLNLRLGRQQVVWGQSIGLRILDVVNPQDYREFILDDFIDARIPLVGAKLDAVWAGTTFEAFAFPEFRPSLLANPESEFALEPSLRGYLPALQPVPGAGRFVAAEIEDERNPKSWRGSTTAFGVRLARTWHGVDLSLNYYDAYDALQAFRRRVEPETFLGLGPVPVNVITPDHVRTRTVGGSFSTSFSSFTLWGEGGVTFGRAFATSDLAGDGVVRRPEFQSALGLDWTGSDLLFANLQWIQATILDHTGAIEQDHWRNFLSLLLRVNLRHETVLPQLFALYGVGRREAMLRPAVEWKVTDRLSFTVGADFFMGPRDGLLGQYAHDRDCNRVPDFLPVPIAGGCTLEVPPGRPSRAFVRLRWSFEGAL